MKNIFFKIFVFLPFFFPQKKINRLKWIHHDNLIHYRGWDIIVKDLQNNVEFEEDIVIYTFLEDFFHKFSDKYERTIGKKWIGIIHHPVNIEVNSNAINTISKLREIDHLKDCLGIVVLCHDMKMRLKKYIPEDIPIHVIYHPKYGCIGKWKEYSKIEYLDFGDSPKQIKPFLLHCGSHLRDINYFNKIKTEKYEKISIRFGSWNEGRWTEYAPKKTKTPYIHSNINGNYIQRTINLMSDDIYEKLLTNGTVVFIWLTDAAAVNTVLECIVLCVPIIVNRLPAIEEVLGENYPLFVENVEEAQKILDGDGSIILKTHQYLCEIDKTKFTMENFCAEFKCILNYHEKKKIYDNFIEEFKHIPPFEDNFQCFKGGEYYRNRKKNFKNLNPTNKK